MMRSSRLTDACVVLGVFAVMVAGAACADKAFTPVQRAINPRMKLMVTASAAQQVAPSPSYVWVGVGAVLPGGDTATLAMRNAPVTGGTQTFTLDVDISSCLSANAAKGRSGCSIMVGAGLRADTISAADTTGNFFARAFDYVIMGPYDVSSGRAPTIPPIDLSASRFSIFDWRQDDALRLGAAQYVVSTGGTPQYRVLAGTVSGTANPVLYTVTQGADYASFDPTRPTPPQVYPALAIFENGAWRRVLATIAPAFNTGNPGQLQGFMDLTALAPNDVYIAATSGLYRFDGSAFTKISGVTDTLYSVASAPTAGGGRIVIAGGPSGKVWIGYGTSWTPYNTGSNSRFDGVCITGPGEAFASSTVSGALYRFNGTTWTSVPAPNSTAPKLDLQCPGPGQAYVTANGFVLYRWTGSTWAVVPTIGLSLARSLRLAAVSANEIYAASDSGNTDRAFYRFDGTAWTEIARRTTTGPARLWADPRGGAAYIHSHWGRLDKITPSSVTTLSFQPDLRDAVMTSATSAFAVGWNLFLARWDGARWTADAPPAGTQITRALQGVWSDGASNAWAVGEANSILRYSGTAWSVVSSVNKPIATVDNYNGVWGVGSDVWVAGENTILHCRAPTTCAVENSGGGILYSVWGSSASNIFAVGATGRILHYNGTSWSAMASPTSRALARVAGSGASDVWAFGDSVLVHFDGTQWTNYPFANDLRSARSSVPSPNLQGTFQLGLWVISSREAYLGGEGGVIVRWDGSGWRSTNDGRLSFGRRVLAITGAAGCAMAIMEGQSDFPAPTFRRGVGTNGCMAGFMGAPSTWP